MLDGFILSIASKSELFITPLLNLGPVPAENIKSTAIVLTFCHSYREQGKPCLQFLAFVKI